MTGIELIVFLTGVASVGVLARFKIKTLLNQIQCRDCKITALRAKIKKIKEDK